ncbi:multiple coagulation factor deficiency protein 2-like protein [Nephila pilipes]|uniref:Multiple coagulation factor deficiency protein 2-like protein n=1 Tax=Nephila pilipes TaxID=299642 RepID=A0A8X6MGK8_NEPPI|nr:multiple coagulation factor deficiency protein 2-like protein [Nephila pilipes]
MVKLTETGEMSQSEMTFYMIRMHDFDDNGGLDGIELRTAFSHSLEHMSDPDENPDSVDNLVDDVLRFDENENGIVD